MIQAIQTVTLPVGVHPAPDDLFVLFVINKVRESSIHQRWQLLPDSFLFQKETLLRRLLQIMVARQGKLTRVVPLPKDHAISGFDQALQH